MKLLKVIIYNLSFKLHVHTERLRFWCHNQMGSIHFCSASDKNRYRNQRHNANKSFDESLTYHGGFRVAISNTVHPMLL